MNYNSFIVNLISHTFYLLIIIYLGGYSALYTLKDNIRRLPKISVKCTFSPRKVAPSMKTVITVRYPIAIVLLKSNPFNDIINNRVNNTHKAPLRAQLKTNPFPNDSGVQNNTSTIKGSMQFT